MSSFINENSDPNSSLIQNLGGKRFMNNFMGRVKEIDATIGEVKYNLTSSEIESLMS